MSNSGSWIQIWKTDVYRETQATRRDWARWLGAYEPPDPVRVFYVAVDGSDDNEGLSLARPLRTLEAALAKLTQPGDHLYISPGFYAVNGNPGTEKDAVLKPAGAGTLENPIVIRKNPALTGEVYIGPEKEIPKGYIIGSYSNDNSLSHIWWIDLEIIGNEKAAGGVSLYRADFNRLIRVNVSGLRDGTARAEGVRLEAAQGVHIYGCDLSDLSGDADVTGQQPGLVVAGSLDCVVSYNAFFEAGMGIFETRGDRHPELASGIGIQDIQYHHNYFHDLIYEGYRPEATPGYSHVNCEFHHNIALENRLHSGGWYGQGTISGLKYYNNTVVFSSGMSGAMTPPVGNNIECYNNLFYCDTKWDLIGWGASSFSIRDYNAYKSTGKISLDGGHTAAALGANDLADISDPFVNPDIGDYRITGGHALLTAGKDGDTIGATNSQFQLTWIWWGSFIVGDIEAVDMTLSHALETEDSAQAVASAAASIEQALAETWSGNVHTPTYAEVSVYLDHKLTQEQYESGSVVYYSFEDDFETGSELDSNWIIEAGTFSISGGELRTFSTRARAYWNTPTDTHFQRATAYGPSSSAGVIIRAPLDGSDTGYELRYYNDPEVRLQRRNNGSGTDLADFPCNADPASITLEARNTASGVELTVKADGVMLGHYLDSSANRLETGDYLGVTGFASFFGSDTWEGVEFYSYSAAMPIVNAELNLSYSQGIYKLVENPDPGVEPYEYYSVIPGLFTHGTQTVGGRGGDIYIVDSLADTNSGSGNRGTLRWCLNQPSPKYIVFEVAGTINLINGYLDVDSYTTVAGQTAPSPGITLRGSPLRIMDAHDIVIQHIKARSGDEDPDNIGIDNLDSVSIQSNTADCYNIVIDHCSVSWGIDENFQLWYDGIYDVTISNCIIAEGLRNNPSTGEPRSFGLIAGHDTDIAGSIDRLSIVNNLFAQNGGRTPRLKDGARGEIINNVIYNWEWNGARMSDPGTLADVINNYFKPGPETESDTSGLVVENSAQVYASGNIGTSYSGAASSQVTRSNFTPILASEAWDLVLEKAGAFPLDRDVHDTRVVTHTLSGTGNYISAPGDVGGYPTDVATHSLTLPDSPNLLTANSYTHMENWLNGLAYELTGQYPVPGTAPGSATLITSENGIVGNIINVGAVSLGATMDITQTGSETPASPGYIWAWSDNTDPAEFGQQDNCTATNVSGNVRITYDSESGNGLCFHYEDLAPGDYEIEMIGAGSSHGGADQPRILIVTGSGWTVVGGGSGANIDPNGSTVIPFTITTSASYRMGLEILSTQSSGVGDYWDFSDVIIRVATD